MTWPPCWRCPPAVIHSIAVFVQIDLIATRDGIAPIACYRIPKPDLIFWPGWFFLLPLRF
jgi:TRAP-type uncharacterized transport system fused permease subunit